MVRESREDVTPRGAEYSQEVDEERIILAARVSWGAIFAGSAMAMAVWFVLSMLGAAIGLSSFDPSQESNPLSGFGVGVGLWLALQIIIALFVGGWVAGRLAGKPRGLDGALNAGVVWALTVLLGVFGFAKFSASVVSGLGTVVSAGASVAVDAVGGVIDEVGQQTPEGARGRVVGNIQQQAQRMLRQTETRELQPEQLRQRAREIEDIARESAEDIAANPQQAQQELSQAINQAFASLDGVVDAVDRDALVNALVARTEMSRPEAQQTVDAWAKTYEEAVSGLQQTGEDIADSAQAVATDATDAIARALWWMLLGIALGLIAALAGGYLGSPSLETWRRHQRRRQRVVYAGRRGPTTPS